MPRLEQRPVRWPLAALLGGAGVVLAALNAHLLGADIETSPIEPQARTEPAAVTQASAPRKETVDSYTETLKRPLFVASRRFEKPEEPEVAKPVARRPPPPRTLPEGFKLIGVMKEESGSPRALVRSASTPQGLWVGEGDSIDEWRVERIDESSIVMISGGEARELSLFPDRSK